MDSRRRLARLLRRVADWLYVEPTDRLEYWTVEGAWGDHPPLTSLSGWDLRYTR